MTRRDAFEYGVLLGMALVLAMEWVARTWVG